MDVAANPDMLFLAQKIHGVKRLGGSKEVMAKGVSDLFNKDVSFRKFILFDPESFKNALESVLVSNILSDSEDNTNSTITLNYNDGLSEKSDNFSYSKRDGKFEFFRLTPSGETVVEKSSKDLGEFSQFLFNAIKSEDNAKISFEA